MSQYLYLLVKVRTGTHSNAGHHLFGRNTYTFWWRSELREPWSFLWDDEPASQYLYLLVKVRTLQPRLWEIKFCRVAIPIPSGEGQNENWVYRGCYRSWLRSQYLYLLVKVRTLDGAFREEQKYFPSQYLYLLVKVRTMHYYSGYTIPLKSQYLYLLVKVRTPHPRGWG